MPWQIIWEWEDGQSCGSAHDILLHYYIVYTFLQSFIKTFQMSCGVNESSLK